MKLFSKRPCLTPAVHQYLFNTLVSEGAFRQRYAGAFLAAFSVDLAAKYAFVVDAGVEAARRRTGVAQIDEDDKRNLASVLMCLIATEKFGEFEHLSFPFAPDVASAIWMVIFAFSNIAVTINPKATAVVKTCIEETLGDARAYFVDMDSLQQGTVWAEKSKAALDAFDSGTVDADEFAELAIDLLQDPPRVIFS